MAELWRLRPGDAASIVPLNAQVQALHAEAMPDRFHATLDPAVVESFFHDWLAKDHVRAIGAWKDGGLAGYAVFEVTETRDKTFTRAERFGFLQHIVVDRESRRQGIGLRLIEAGKDILRAEGITRLETSYWAFNAASAALMARAGLVPSEVFAEGPV